MTDTSSLGTILGVWAHPDDEANAMAGIMAAASQNGQTVASITATRGELGSYDEVRWPTYKLAQVRSQEQSESLRLVGCTDHTWLDYPDGGCDKVKTDEAVARITAVMKRLQPDSVFTFDLDGYTGHPDHRTVSHWAAQAFKKAAKDDAKLYYWALTPEGYQELRQADKKFNLFFNIDRPKITPPEELAISFELTDELVKIKSQALCSHLSQYEKWLETLGKDYFATVQKTECFRLGDER